MRVLVASYAVAALAVASHHLAGQAENPMQYASIALQGSCGDGLNSRVFLANRHQSRDIMATVRWRVANGQFSSQQFRINAGMRQQIGCAADARIVSARFLTSGEQASSFVRLSVEGRCDQLNNRIFLTNRHSARDILATVRWRVANGEYVTHQFRINATLRTQIGCAADARIAAARFLN
jgi:cytochrome c-type biogenesis protein CcmH/NrfF